MYYASPYMSPSRASRRNSKASHCSSFSARRVSASVKAPSKWVIQAHDAFSGVLLWKKPITPWENQLRPFRSGPAEMPRRLVAVGDTVYVTLGYGKPVSVTS